MNIRSGFYCNYESNECKMYGKSSGWIISCKDGKDIQLTNKEARHKILSAYKVSTFCNYQSGRYFIEYIAEDEVCLNPDLDTLTRVLGKHPYDHGIYRLEIPYKEFSKEVSSIWEEREKISGFKFDVSKIQKLNINLSS